MMLVVDASKATCQLLVFPECAPDLRGPEYNGRHVCRVNDCVLASVDLIRLSYSLMDIDLGFCRAHALAAVHEHGVEWDDVLQSGEPYEDTDYVDPA